MRTEQDHGRVNAKRLRLYHSMYQLFTFTMLLCLLSNNVGVLWVAMEGATLSTVLLVSLYRTPASLEAAWKYFILCSVGLAQALFGTILLYFAAEKVLGPGGTALLWTHLHQVRGQLEPTVLSLAFVFLLVGYGTKVGLVPAAQLAARRARRRPDPDLGGALGAAPQRRALRGGAQQSARRRSARAQFLRWTDDGIRFALGRRCGVLPFQAARHQAHVRLFVGRAHGHHDLRVRHGRRGGGVRGPLCT